MAKWWKIKNHKLTKGVLYASARPFRPMHNSTVTSDEAVFTLVTLAFREAAAVSQNSATLESIAASAKWKVLFDFLLLTKWVKNHLFANHHFQYTGFSMVLGKTKVCIISELSYYNYRLDIRKYSVTSKLPPDGRYDLTKIWMWYDVDYVCLC